MGAPAVCPVPVSRIDGKGTTGVGEGGGWSGPRNMQGARTVPVQLNCAQGKVTIGLDGDAATTTRSCSQPVSSLWLPRCRQ